MKTQLPTAITTRLEAEALLTALHSNGEAYHPEDAAGQIISYETHQRLFSDTEAAQLDLLMEQIYNLPGNDGNHAGPLSFDPCEHLLNLDNPRQFFVKDQTGTGHHFPTNAAGLKSFFNDQIEELDTDAQEEALNFITGAEAGDDYNDFPGFAVTCTSI